MSLFEKLKVRRHRAATEDEIRAAESVEGGGSQGTSGNDPPGIKIGSSQEEEEEQRGPTTSA
jgi:hypothetical protein